MALPVALQLYSVRDELSKNFKRTIEAVAEMGYDGVELSGFPDDISAVEIRAILDKYNLKAMSVHCPFAKMESDTGIIFENAHICGCEYLVIPWLDKDTALSDSEIDNTLKKITELGKKAYEAGLTLLYHNHDFEFRKIDGEYILDIIYKNVPELYLKTQIDTCWVNVGGENPEQYIRKYSGRAPVVHLKDFSGTAGGTGMYGLIGSDKTEEKSGDFRFRPIGSGVQNVEAIVKASEDAGASWIVVEQDNSPDMPSLDAAKMSREYLRSIGW